MTPQPLKESQNGELWELIGLRVRGLETPLLGAVRFRRQDTKTNARRSLAHFLSTPTHETALRSRDYPADLLRLALKDKETSFQSFVRALNSGATPQILLVDVSLIELAFDFRLQNPSIERARFAAREVRRMLLRTIDGHVLSGWLHAPEERLHRRETFIGLSGVQQRTFLGNINLPNLILHRRYLSVAADTAACCPASSPVFEPGRSASMPIVGLPAWRHYLQRKESADSPEDLLAASA